MTWLQDWIECRLLPALAGRMPWPMFFRLGRRLCARPWLFSNETRSSLSAAASFGQVHDPVVWQQNHALVRLVDQVDASISARRSDAWIDRYVEVDGQWPVGPFVGITFHFGAGLWAIRHLRRSGQRAAFLSGPQGPDMFPGHPLRHAFEARRMAEVERAGGAAPIYLGGSLDKMRSALADGVSVIGLIDVAPSLAPVTRPTHFFGRPARFPDGLLHLARSWSLPVAVFVCYPDMQSGRRRLTIRQVDAQRDDALDLVLNVLETSISAAPWAWHFWPAAAEFFDGSNGATRSDSVA
jgi:hypothetical protein